MRVAAEELERHHVDVRVDDAAHVAEAVLALARRTGRLGYRLRELRAASGLGEVEERCRSGINERELAATDAESLALRRQLNLEGIAGVIDLPVAVGPTVGGACNGSARVAVQEGLVLVIEHVRAEVGR